MEPNLIQIFGSYMSWKLNENTWIINFMNGSQNMYLLEGREKALLIDTGWGAGNLRALVEKLTSKPVIVTNTHGHLDHSGGNGEWEEVLMLPGSEGDLFTCHRSPFDVSKLPFPDYVRKIVKDGDRVELGGRTIELIDISAHSNGSLAYLDRGAGFLFVGDELESAQVLMYETEAIPGYAFDLDARLRAHHKNMLRLRALEGQWNTLLPAHNGAPIAHGYLDDYISLVEHIYAGDAIIEDKLNHFYAEQSDPEHRLCRVRRGSASFFVNKADMMKLYGANTL
ncbi:MAG: MBL fold metallo-hydrolase [Saccharofermentanales bacterium]|jgi:hydroxyacylglutathione hydrolase|nr:MBL fold metallo-hydrolase [Clostridiaceae bacterium]